MTPFRDESGPVDECGEAHERTVLQPADFEAFFAALDSPPAEALRAAFERHRKTVDSRQQRR